MISFFNLSFSYLILPWSSSSLSHITEFQFFPSPTKGANVPSKEQFNRVWPTSQTLINVRSFNLNDCERICSPSQHPFRCCSVYLELSCMDHIIRLFLCYLFQLGLEEKEQDKCQWQPLDQSLTKGHIVKAMFFSSTDMYRYESWTLKKARRQRIDAF